MKVNWRPSFGQVRWALLSPETTILLSNIDSLELWKVFIKIFIVFTLICSLISSFCSVVISPTPIRLGRWSTKALLLSTPVLFLEVVCFSPVFLCHVLLQLLFLFPLWVDPFGQEILPKNYAWSVTTTLVTNRWNRRFLLNFLENFLHSLFTPLLSLKCSLLLPQC